MKTKRTVISIFTLCTALLFTSCSGKGTSNAEASRDTPDRSRLSFRQLQHYAG